MATENESPQNDEAPALPQVKPGSSTEDFLEKHGKKTILLVILAAFELICVLLAAVHASRGEAYRYPFSLRLIS